MARYDNTGNESGALNATELVKGPDGKEKSIPLGELSPGDHTISLADHRQFLVHVPQSTGSEELPVMFLFTGSEQPQYDPKEFGIETGMNTQASDPRHEFIAVYPLPKLHKIGQGSSVAAYAWNSEGCLLSNEDRQAAGYDDLDYVKQIVDLVPKITHSDPTHKDWGATAFSQGGLFLNKIVTEVPNLFPSVFLVGTAMESDATYKPLSGNARDVGIVQLLGDHEVLPMPGNEDWLYKGEKVLRAIAQTFGLSPQVEKLNPLAAIHNERENPQMQESVYVGMLGQPGVDYSEKLSTFSTPKSAQVKDSERQYQPTNPDNHRLVTVIDLAQAQHNYPEPDHGVTSDGLPKYTEFDTTAAIANQFAQYNRQSK